MKPLYYNRTSKLFLYLSFGLFIFSITTAILVLSAEYPMSPSFNSQGFANFINIFSFPLKLLTASLATFVVWLTLERLAQTERQIDAITDNNKFNNYGKHLQDFIDHLKESSLFVCLYEEEKVTQRGVIAAVYKLYYAETYRDFKPHMKEIFRREIDGFLQELRKSKVSEVDCNLENTSIDEIIRISDMASEHVGELIEPLTQKVVLRIKMRYGILKTQNQQIQSIINRFQRLHKIYWTIAFYRSLLSFDGTIEGVAGYYYDNYERYTKLLEV
jgi:hypothetical protein